MILPEILKKGKISNVIEMAQVYDFLLNPSLKEEEKNQIKKMMFEFKVRFISQIKK